MTEKSVGRLITLLAANASLTLGFHLLGSYPVFAAEWSLTWLDQADPEVAVAALLRVIGLILCYWVLITTTIYALSRSRGRVPRTIRWMTIPAIRYIVDRALATTLLISALAVPSHPLAAAEDPEPGIVLEIHGDRIPLPHLRPEPVAPGATPADPTPGPHAAASPIPLLLAPPAAAPAAVLPVAALPGEENYTVAPGDSLWLIAETQVQAATGDIPTEQMIATYWRELIDINIAGLRSRNPNLIYAGELLTLPKLEVQP